MEREGTSNDVIITMIRLVSVTNLLSVIIN